MGNLSILFIAIVFLVMIGLLALRRPLYQAVLGSLVAVIILFRIAPAKWPGLVLNVFRSWSSLSVLVSLYLTTLLQRIMAHRHMIEQAQNDLNGMFHNNRVTTTGGPLFIGLLPSAAAMILCSDIVKEGTDGYLEPKEQAVFTNWVRHIPEAIIPTYPNILLLCSYSGVTPAQFLPAMIIPVIVQLLLVYFMYLRRIPREPEKSSTDGHFLLHLKNLCLHIWPLALVLILILVFDLGVVESLAISDLICLLVFRFSFAELKELFISAFERKMLLNYFLVLVLKEFIFLTNVLQDLPGALSALPIPPYLIFTIMFFFGTMISSSSGVIALVGPLAFEAVGGDPLPLMILLTAAIHGSGLLSPIHVCLTVCADCFNISLGDLIRKSVPIVILFMLLMIVYYNLFILI